MHVLLQLRELEARYPDQIAVVGVHSGKYTAERETPRIRDASIRLDAIHPTINDRQFRLWRAYAVRAWPALVAIDPGGYVVGMQAGEFTAHSVTPFVDRVIADARSVPSARPGISVSPTASSTSRWLALIASGASGFPTAARRHSAGLARKTSTTRPMPRLPSRSRWASAPLAIRCISSTQNRARCASLIATPQGACAPS